MTQKRRKKKWRSKWKIMERNKEEKKIEDLKKLWEKFRNENHWE